MSPNNSLHVLWMSFGISLNVLEINVDSSLHILVKCPCSWLHVSEMSTGSSCNELLYRTSHLLNYQDSHVLGMGWNFVHRYKVCNLVN